MNNDEIIKLAFDNASGTSIYWNFFLVVSTAILGALASGKEFTQSKALKVVMTIAFIVFAVSNLKSLLSVLNQREALLAMLTNVGPKLASLCEALSGLKRGQLITFHLIADLVVLSAIWLVPWHKIGSDK
jgi:predicted branched-subunit amino acid permease